MRDVAYVAVDRPPRIEIRGYPRPSPRDEEWLAAGRLPGVSLLLALSALAVALIPTLAGRLQYERPALAAGELWRLLTCHFTHWSAEHLAWDALVFLAYAYQHMGQRKLADGAIERCQAILRSKQENWLLNRLILPDTLAATYALQGREDEAVSTLERAFEDGWTIYSVLRYSPYFEGLRTRDDFQQLMSRVRGRIDELRDRVREADA